MFSENLRIAIRSRKGLFSLFGLTILCPAILLSVFGIWGIRNEKFRLERQAETEFRRETEDLKALVLTPIVLAENRLRNLVKSIPAEIAYIPALKTLAERELEIGGPIVRIFLVRREMAPLFFGDGFTSTRKRFVSPLPTEEQNRLIKAAEEAEFQRDDFDHASILYEKALTASKDRNFQAKMIAAASRCRFHKNDFSGAVAGYERILKEFPGTRGNDDLPLGPAVRFQLGEISLLTGEPEKALGNFLDAYQSVLDPETSLTEEQFKAYASLAEEKTAALIQERRSVLSKKAIRLHDDLVSKHHRRLSAYEDIALIKKLILPELEPRLFREGTVTSQAIRFAKAIDQKTYLILALQLTPSRESESSGSSFLCARIDEAGLLSAIREKMEPRRSGVIRGISLFDLSGKALIAAKAPLSGPLSSEYFSDGFPPWKMEIGREKAPSFGISDLGRSFYFWTVLLMLVILISGTVFAAQAMIREAELVRLKAGFVSAVSHDLKSPLASIKALVERLAGGKVKDEESLKRYISILSANTDRLSKTIDHVLDFSRIDHGGKRYDFRETDAVDLVRRTCRAFEELMTPEGVELNVRADEGFPPTEWDEESVVQALTNLLDNAVKFSPQGKEIEVCVKRKGEDAAISVSDQGQGIKPEERKMIFEKYYQGGNSGRTSPSGVGLGLSIVQDVVKAHGGRITVESKEGHGSVFTLILPLKTTKKRPI